MANILQKFNYFIDTENTEITPTDENVIIKYNILEENAVIYTGLLIIQFLHYRTTIDVRVNMHENEKRDVIVTCSNADLLSILRTDKIKPRRNLPPTSFTTAIWRLTGKYYKTGCVLKMARLKQRLIHLQTPILAVSCQLRHGRTKLI
jgi:hypothetical protein